jgi:hypothetical protein
LVDFEIGELRFEIGIIFFDIHKRIITKPTPNPSLREVDFFLTPPRAGSGFI